MRFGRRTVRRKPYESRESPRNHTSGGVAVGRHGSRGLDEDGGEFQRLHREGVEAGGARDDGAVDDVVAGIEVEAGGAGVGSEVEVAAAVHVGADGGGGDVL